MKILITVFLSLLILLINIDSLFAITEKDYQAKMEVWEHKRELASQYLLEAEKAFKAGDELQGCASQREASEMGIEATKSLITAMETNGSSSEIENLQVGLNMWTKLGNIC